MKRFLALWIALLLLSWYPVQAARDFVEASSNYLTVAEAIVTTQSATIAAWVYPNQTNLVQHAVTIGDSTIANMYMSLRLSATATVQAAIHDGTFSTAATTATYSASTWSHITAVFVSDSERHAYLNGANKASNTTPRTALANLNRTRIASHHSGAPRLNGRVAEVAIWNVPLTDAEVAALPGSSPRKIRPANLVSYVPIWGDHSPEIDVARARTWTLNGTPARAPHAPVGLFSMSFGR